LTYLQFFFICIELQFEEISISV